MIIESLLAAALLVSQPSVEAYEVDITTPCYKLADFYAHAGKFRVVVENTLTSESNMTIRDVILASDTQKTIFVVRENKALGKVCILSFFEQGSKKKDKYY